MAPQTISPPQKRIKLEPSITEEPAVAAAVEGQDEPKDGDSEAGEHCSICLQPLMDRTVIPICSHEFCFECLLVWTDQSRRCPLCSQTIGEYLIHHIRSKYDYQKHYLTPLRTSPQPLLAQRNARRRVATRREREWGRRQRREWEEADELERAIEKRRWVYRHGLYAKHVASNSYTRYRPISTPAQFAVSPDLISRATAFLRRELRVWVGLDVEFLTTFTLSLMKSLDIRSESAVRLLAEFLDLDSGGERTNAEHFAHELYSYLRSPYRDISVYDTVVQYDVPSDLPPPTVPESSRRWRPPAGPRSRSRSRSRSIHRRSLSRSPNSDHDRPEYERRRSPQRANRPRDGRSAPDSSRRSQYVEERATESDSGRAADYRRPRHRRKRTHEADSNAESESGEARIDTHSRPNLPNDVVREDRDEEPAGTRSAGDIKGKGKSRQPFAGSPSSSQDLTPGREYRRRVDSPNLEAGGRKSSMMETDPPNSGPDHLPTATITRTSRAGDLTQHAFTSSTDDCRAGISESMHGSSGLLDPLRNLGPATATTGHQPERRTVPTRVRGRNLLASVQAHLSGNNTTRAPRSADKGKGIDKQQQSSRLGTEKDGPLDDPLDVAHHAVHETPSLLEGTDGPESTPCTRPLPTSLDGHDLESTDSPKNYHRVAMSAPDIMARTRARLARLKQDTSADVSPAPFIAELSIDEPAQTPRRSSEILTARVAGRSNPDSAATSDSDPPRSSPLRISAEPTAPASPATTPLDSERVPSSTPPAALAQREVLLRKLAAAKRLQGNAGAPAGANDASPANGLGALINRGPVPMEVAGGSDGGGNDGDCLGPALHAATVTPVVRAEEREATLRSQAQLRVRLAAAKRASADQRGAEANADIESGGGEKAISGGNAGTREELLRAKLIQRRT